MRDPKHPRQFTEEFRRQIVALVDSGKPRAEVMRECDLGKSTLDRWIRRVHACGSSAVLTPILNTRLATCLSNLITAERSTTMKLIGAPAPTSS